METEHIGKVVIAPEVLITIAKLSTLGIPGVARMAQVSGGIDRYFQRGAFEGVRIKVLDDHTLQVELFIVLKGEANMHAVSEQVQAEVARAMLEMVGMDTASVDVHIAEIEYGES